MCVCVSGVLLVSGSGVLLVFASVVLLVSGSGVLLFLLPVPGSVASGSGFFCLCAELRQLVCRVVCPVGWTSCQISCLAVALNPGTRINDAAVSSEARDRWRRPLDEENFFTSAPAPGARSVAALLLHRLVIVEPHDSVGPPEQNQQEAYHTHTKEKERGGGGGAG